MGNDKIKTALISVHSKTGLSELAKGLNELGVQIISTKGTTKYLQDQGVKAKAIEEIYQTNELLEGRVKTLDRRILAGILAKRNKEHLKQLEEENASLIDLVIVNFYPFKEGLLGNKNEQELTELIDVGGLTLARSAAKNSDNVAVIIEPSDYQKILSELKENNGSLSLKTKKELAAKVFAFTAEYDSIISNYFMQKYSGQSLPERISLPFEKVRDLRYGENPHQKGSLYATPFSDKDSLSRAKLLQGKEMSFNNYFDVNAAIQIISEFEEPAVSIVKHANPCGVAIADDVETAFVQAFESDEQSAFGGIIALNRLCNESIAKKITAFFNELVAAPEFSVGALNIFKKKPNIRLLQFNPKNIKGRKGDFFGVHDFKFISNGLLLQEQDSIKEEKENFKVVTKARPSKEQMDGLLFGLKVVKHVKSNAIVIVKNTATIGIGAGQMSRVDSMKIALAKAFGRERNSVLAGDAFFPFRDSIDLAAEHGIKAIIQPGGSVKDNEVIQACDEHGIAMVFTGVRHFRH